MCCTILIAAIVFAFTGAGAFIYEYSSLFTLLGGTSVPLLFFYWFRTYLYYRNVPPGPRGLPVLGKLLELNLFNALLKCQEYAETFGRIFSMNCGQYYVVVLNDHKLIQEALKKDELQGRPDFQPWNNRPGDYKNRGMLFSEGKKTWQEQRLAAVQTLADISGKPGLESKLILEAKELVQELNFLTRTSSSESIDLKRSINSSVINSLWNVLSGQRFNLNDAEFQGIVTAISTQNESQGLFSLGNYFPWLAIFDLIMPTGWAKSLKSIKKVKRGYNMISGLIANQIASYSESITPRGYIDGYLHSHLQLLSTSDVTDQELGNLQVTLVDLFQAGSETTATTLLWAIFFLSKHPEIQQRIQKEIQFAIGANGVPSRLDRSKMIFLEAFINEVHRKASVVPMTAFHKVTKDCKLGGYSVKKDFIVLPNLYAIHHDEKYWGDPQNFRPERFLDPSETKISYKEALLPFSTGKRMCLGELVARDTLYFFLTILLQNFSFTLDTTPEDPEDEWNIPTPNFINLPKDFKVILTSRK